MTETPLHWLTISELSQRMRQGALSPVELAEHMLSRLEALDGTLHAFKLVARERALAQAQAAELALKAGQDVGPLHGIPMLPRISSTSKVYRRPLAPTCWRITSPLQMQRSSGA